MQQRFSFIRCLEKPPPRTHIYTRGEEKRRSEERREERQYDGPVVSPIRHSCVRRKSSLPPWGIFVPRTTSLPEEVLARSTPFLPPRSPLNKYLNRTTTLGSRRCSFRLEIRRYYAFPSHARTHARTASTHNTRGANFLGNCTTRRGFVGSAHVFYKTRSLDNEIYARSAIVSSLDVGSLDALFGDRGGCMQLDPRTPRNYFLACSNGLFYIKVD